MSKQTLYKLMLLLHIIGTIMYVGGILSHIIIANVLDQTDLNALVDTAIYKERSAFILIVPGIALKTISGLVLLTKYKKKPLWLKVKLGLAAFLLINAIVFLTPMMSELTELAKESRALGEITPAYHAKEHWEKIVGMSNALPLLLVLILGVIKPKRSN
ncbi:MAG: DUF2269 family protein [Candidatus Krumholzibacteria bacterium]|nr:DUF2269 family protein [Candidatus Krumholzibacteria bacterium]